MPLVCALRPVLGVTLCDIMAYLGLLAGINAIVDVMQMKNGCNNFSRFFVIR